MAVELFAITLSFQLRCRQDDKLLQNTFVSEWRGPECCDAMWAAAAMSLVVQVAGAGGGGHAPAPGPPSAAPPQQKQGTVVITAAPAPGTPGNQRLEKNI